MFKHTFQVNLLHLYQKTGGHFCPPDIILQLPAFQADSLSDSTRYRPEYTFQIAQNSAAPAPRCRRPSRNLLAYTACVQWIPPRPQEDIREKVLSRAEILRPPAVLTSVWWYICSDRCICTRSLQECDRPLNYKSRVRVLPDDKYKWEPFRF